MPTYTTSAEAMQRMVATIKEHAPLIPGLSASSRYVIDSCSALATEQVITVHWTREFAVSCSMVAFIESGKVHTELHWRDIPRGAAVATEAIALYSQVAQLACLLESIASSMEIADVVP